jgi:hypothetical protein
VSFGWRIGDRVSYLVEPDNISTTYRLVALGSVIMLIGPLNFGGSSVEPDTPTLDMTPLPACERANKHMRGEKAARLLVVA